MVTNRKSDQYSIKFSPTIGQSSRRWYFFPHRILIFYLSSFQPSHVKVTELTWFQTREEMAFSRDTNLIFCLMSGCDI